MEVLLEVKRQQVVRNGLEMLSRTAIRRGTAPGGEKTNSMVELFRPNVNYAQWYSVRSRIFTFAKKYISKTVS